MVTAPQILDVDVQLMILDVVWEADHFHQAMMLMSKHS